MIRDFTKTMFKEGDLVEATYKLQGPYPEEITEDIVIRHITPSRVMARVSITGARIYINRHTYVSFKPKQVSAANLLFPELSYMEE